MVKKIGVIILALILCLSAIVVPVSAAELSGTDIAFSLKWDKEYYKAGDTAVLSVYMAAADDLALGTGNISIGLNSTFISQADNVPLDCITVGDVFASYYKEFTSSTCKETTSAYKTQITNANTEEENATYDWYIRLGLSKAGTSGTHENANNNKDGLRGTDIDPTVPILTFTFTVASTATDGATIPAAITYGSVNVKTAAAGTHFKYYTSPGTATTTANVAAADFDVSQAVATAKVGNEPCADDAHVWDNGVETTAPTCGEAGVKTYTCSVCNHTKTEDVPATGNHTAAEAVKENEVAASCSVSGSYESVVYCSVCGAEISRETVEVPATGAHVYATETDRKEATCTEDGYVVKACGCGATETTTIPMTGHTEEDIPAVDATCTTDGATAGVKCSVCDEVITAPTTVPSAGHTEETVVENEVAATCTTDGSYESVVNCTVCETEISRETVVVPATGHSYGEGVQTKSATCEKPGETRYTCSACGYVDKRAEPAAKGHTEVVVPAVAPTCVNPGYEEGTVCSVCNSTVVARKKIEPLGHTKDEGVVTPPTYSSQGYTTYNCTVCGVEFKDDIVGMLPINFAVAIQEPSITEIRCKDTIVLHAVTTTGEELPDDVTVVWTADNENFKTNEIDDGRALEITSKNKGNTVFTVTVYDVNGTVLSSDTVEMYSNAGFFAKIGGFFRTIFGLTKYYEA